MSKMEIVGTVILLTGLMIVAVVSIKNAITWIMADYSRILDALQSVSLIVWGGILAFVGIIVLILTWGRK